MALTKEREKKAMEEKELSRLSSNNFFAQFEKLKDHFGYIDHNNLSEKMSALISELEQVFDEAKLLVDEIEARM